MTGTASSPPVPSRIVVTLVSILAPSLSSAASAVEGKARRQSSAIARIKYLTRIFIASTPVLLGPADLLKAGGRLLCVGVSRGTRERRSPLESRSATAKVGFGNRAILIIQDLWLCVPASRQVCLYRSRRGIGATRTEVEHFLDELAEEVSPSWLRPPGRRSDRPRRCGAIRRGRSASQPGSWRRSTDQVRCSTSCNDAAPQNLSRGRGRTRDFFFGLHRSGTARR